MKCKLHVMLLVVVQLMFATTSLAAYSNTNDEIVEKYVVKIFDEYTKCDYNLFLLEQAYNDLCGFCANYDESTAAEFKSVLHQRIEGYIQQLMLPQEVIVDDVDIVHLRNTNLDASVIADHNMAHGMFYDEMKSRLEVYDAFIREYNQFSKNNCEFESSKLSLESNYYYVLYTLSSLPDYLKDIIASRINDLNYKFDVSLTLPAEEYERLIAVTIHKIEDIVAELNAIVNQRQLYYDNVEYIYESYEKAYDAFGVAVEKFIGVSSTTINNKDSQEKAYQKIKKYSDALDTMVATASEYLSLFEELGNHGLVDMLEVQAEKDGVTQFINDKILYRDNLISEYNVRGWGQYR